MSFAYSWSSFNLPGIDGPYLLQWREHNSMQSLYCKNMPERHDRAQEIWDRDPDIIIYFFELAHAKQAVNK